MLKCKIINMAILAWQKLTMLNKEYMREYKMCVISLVLHKNSRSSRNVRNNVTV